MGLCWGIYWGYIGALGLYWAYFGFISGFILGHWVYIGSILGLYWVYIGDILGLYWGFIWATLGLYYWVYIGVMLGLYCGYYEESNGSKSVRISKLSEGTFVKMPLKHFMSGSTSSDVGSADTMLQNPNVAAQRL